MHITRHTDYALRVLMYLALKKGENATVVEIAERFEISRHHLTKVVQRLHQKGHLLATRGKNGGLTLLRPPQEINLGRVFRDMENELGLVECMREDGACALDVGCGLKRTFGEARDAFLEVLDARSLADLIPDGSAARMREALAISA
ncbi:MAG: Rrf2 family transcriptional regulator [Halioglobus sp.]|nr:Rrf2 family transcriptional regulator [Halioglobus sp.]